MCLGLRAFQDSADLKSQAFEEVDGERFLKLLFLQSVEEKRFDLSGFHVLKGEGENGHKEAFGLQEESVGMSLVDIKSIEVFEEVEALLNENSGIEYLKRNDARLAYGEEKKQCAA